ncbi:MAG: DNA polymerase III subunit epsilon, partial [Eggerthellaceae bacterium]|nr:DNA polymerase III subunit epsilon [Eggerthellaceae bacterium]
MKQYKSPVHELLLCELRCQEYRRLRKRRKRVISQSSKRDAEALASDPTIAMSFPDASEIAAAFEPGGLVSTMYGRFEKRAEQEQMSQAVLDAFSRSQNLAVEAGTGVGKSMAYLLPAALVAKRNGITIGVATKTNALLDQLVFHELPLISEALGGVDIAALKGFSHYPCLRKIGNLVLEGAQTKTVQGKEVSTAPALAALLSFVEQTEFDDIDSLKLDYRALPRWSITTTSFDCLRRKCPYYGTMCFVHGARRLAEDADIVVTNHSLLFCDLKADGNLLPPIRHWVIDEAHGAEAEARKAFSVEIDTEGLTRLQSRVGAEEASKNVLVRAQRLSSLLSDGGGAELLRDLAGKAISLGHSFKESSKEFAEHINDLLFFEGNRYNKDYETVELWLNDDIRASSVYRSLGELNRMSVEDAEKLIRTCQDIVGFLDDYEQAADIQREIASAALSLKEYIQTSEILFGGTQGKYVFSATLCRKSTGKGSRKGNRKTDRKPEKLQALILDVGDELNERLYAKTHSVVFTSATLAVGDSFESFEHAVGLNRGENSRSTSLQLASSYAFDENMVVYVPSDIPEPNDPAYLSALQKLLVRAHLALRGSTLTLFTNRKEMESCFDVVYPELKQHDLRLVCQKWGVSVKGLRDDFLSDESLSLFALKSFWEGFDAPGDTLRSVIIPK